MIDYSLARNRLIGMIQTDENNNLHKVGCVGKIHSFNETVDGRYLISLQGINCFTVTEELNKDYAFRVVNTHNIKNDENKTYFNENEKNSLINKYKDYIKIKNINLDLEEIEKIELTQLIKFIAMVSPFNDIDKQVLLEAKNLREFYIKLHSVIDLELVGEFSNNTIN